MAPPIIASRVTLSDPNLRRLLDASHVQDAAPCHFLFRQRYTLTEQQKMDAARTINERMLSQLPPNQALEPDLKNPAQFRAAIDNMLAAQEYYDKKLFGDMGVE